MLRRRHYKEEKTTGKAEGRKKETQADRKDRNTSRGIPSGFEDLTNTENINGDGWVRTTDKCLMRAIKHSIRLYGFIQGCYNIL